MTEPTLTRIPTKCFLDFRPNGGLCHILATVYKLISLNLHFLNLIKLFLIFHHRFRTDNGWRQIDFASPSRMDRHIEMMKVIHKALIKSKCLVQPVICIMPEVDKAIIGKVVLLFKAINILY